MIWVSPLWFTEVRERIRKKSSEPLSHTSFKSKSKAREGNHWLDFGSNLSQSISHAGFCHLRSSGSFLLCIESGLSRLSTTSKCVLSVLCCTTKYNKVSLSKSQKEIRLLRYSHSYKLSHPFYDLQFAAFQT